MRKKPRHEPFKVGIINLPDGEVDVGAFTKDIVDGILAKDDTFNQMTKEMDAILREDIDKIEEKRIATMKAIGATRAELKKELTKLSDLHKRMKIRKNAAVRDWKRRKAIRHTYRKRCYRAVEKQIIAALRRKLNIRQTWGDKRMKREIQSTEANHTDKVHLPHGNIHKVD